MEKNVYYAALGDIACERHSVEKKLNGKLEIRSLMEHEWIIWMNLYGHIMHRTELLQTYIAWQKTTQHYISDVDSIAACDETIERLLNRGLITKGEGDSTADALYQLLFPLNIIRSQYSLLFSTIMMSRDIGLFRAIWIRLRERKSASGRIILKLIEHQPLTVEHIIVCLGTGKTLVTTESDLQQINSIAAQSLKNYVWLRDIVVKQIIKFINWHVVLLEAN